MQVVEPEVVTAAASFGASDVDGDDTQQQRYDSPDQAAVKDGGTGSLGNIASRVLMKIFYSARDARFDLLRAINYLATHVTKWSNWHDRALHRLVSYINSTLDYRQIGYVGDKLEDLQCTFWSDASFASCQSSQRSTTGMHFAPEYQLSDCSV